MDVDRANRSQGISEETRGGIKFPIVAPKATSFKGGSEETWVHLPRRAPPRSESKEKEIQGGGASTMDHKEWEGVPQSKEPPAKSEVECLPRTDTCT